MPSQRRSKVAVWSVCLLAIAATIQPVFGQLTVKAVPVAAEPSKPTEGVASSADTASQAATAAAAAARKTRRLEMIRGLTFDRRPSAILKAWKEPPAAEIPAVAAAGPVATPAVTVETPPADALAASNTPAAAAKTAEQAQAELSAKQAEETKRQAAEDAAFQKELAALQRHVTLGQWNDVKNFHSKLELEEAQTLYGQLLTSLQSGSMGRMNADPNMLQQLLVDGSDISKIQQQMSQLGQGAGAAYTEKNLISMPDILGLLVSAPGEFEDAAIRNLGQMLQLSIQAGFDLNVLLSSEPVILAQQGSRVIETPESTPKTTVATGEPLPRPAHQLAARDMAKVLSAARQEIRANDFLPTMDEARIANDGAGLNLIARSVLAKYTEDQKTQGLDQAWAATQYVLEIPLPPEPVQEIVPTSTTTVQSAAARAKAAIATNASAAGTATSAAQAGTKADPAQQRFRIAKATRDEALTRAVELAPKVRKELGQKWLDDSFRERAQRGKEILTAIGAATSSNLASHPNDRDYRKRGLELQKTAVDAMLAGSPDQISDWNQPLTVIAVAWLKEAQVSRDLDDSAGSRGWRRDQYGNYYMFDNDGSMPMQRFGRGNISAIKIDDVLEVRPDAKWLTQVATDLQPKFTELFAQLYLKLQDERAAFPYIEDLSKTHPKRAKDLAEEFLRVWATNHNPNDKRDGYNPFYYYMSYERRADRIPLTRSKQQRNLTELAEWVSRLKTLPIGDLNEKLLTNAFTTAHSKAEVYQLEAIEGVFGSIGSLKPRTLAELIQQMRGNLAGVWRMPDVQRQNSTNRKQRDMRAEVLHGYEVAQKVTQDGLQKYPNHWALLLAHAAVMHDEIDYEKEAEKSSDFSKKRSDALDLFRQAANAYVATVEETPIEEQTVLPFEMWFYASLGSVDLARITADKSPDLKQPPLIREALLSLPGEAATRHMSQFSNNLFTRATEAKPELKSRYLRAGFDIVGDHKLAREARKLLEYYGDLITEIKLETRIDGSDNVGHKEPFGVFVNLVHTKEIERESGGFGKYLQNQNNPQMYYYNFGRPLENYRDKFRDYVTKAVGEHFDVLSITFQEASVNSRALPDYGWRMTPYAYLLLKAKGPEVDKLAPLRMDLDFLDTSGYALLPIESPALPLDAKKDSATSRPVEDLVVTQTLDERQASKGKLLLEIRATARGLVPELTQLMDIKSNGFEIEKVDDRGLAVLEFDKDFPDNAVRSERQWTVSLTSPTEMDQRPKSFSFGIAKIPAKEMTYNRYEDADLKAVASEVSLEAKYGKVSWTKPIMATLGVLGAAGLGLFGLRSLSRRPTKADSKFRLPEQLTPFTVIGFLKELETRAGFDDSSRRELAQAVESIERHYFQSPQHNPPDLERIAARWHSAAHATL